MLGNKTNLAVKLAVLSSALLVLSGCVAPDGTAPEASQSASSSDPSPTETTSEPEETEESQARPRTTPSPIDAGNDSSEAESSNNDQAASQSIDYTIAGGCQGSYEAVGYYGIFEEFADDCYLIVSVYPASPSRYAQLQYLDDTWTTESSGWTDDDGIVYLDVDTYCEGGAWCDGVWDYRVLVDAEGSLPSDKSTTFELEFIPW